MKTINPWNDEVIAEYKYMKEPEVQKALNEAHHGYKTNSQLSVKDRKKALISIKSILKRDMSKISELMTIEMGKPILQSKAEVKKCITLIDYYHENIEKFLEDKVIETEYEKSFISYRPLGVILGIMPWNFPLWQVLRFSIPTILTGNSVLIKHADNVTGTALRIEKIFEESTFSNNVYKALIIDHQQTKKVIENKIIKAISLTGSTKAGKEVSKTAAACLKKLVLELGGSDPYLVLKDADLDLAVEKLTESRILNNGQSCIAAKRFIVHESISEKFEEKLKSKFMELKVGNPLSEDTQIGPLARLDLKEKLEEQVNLSINSGAKKIFEGTNFKGCFYSPVILTNVTKDVLAFSEELFGPVASIIKFKELSEAIEIANATNYGLGAGVFTKDLELAKEIATSKIQSGACFINDFVKSDPRLPFGGIKESGYGRELSSESVYEFVNIKTICF